MDRYYHERRPYEDVNQEFEYRAHRGRLSPVLGPVYTDPRGPFVPRPAYFSHGSASYLVPEGGIRRTRSNSRTHRDTPPVPPPAPVIINNKIYNEHPEQLEDDRFLQLSPQSQPRTRSRSRHRERASSHESHESHGSSRSSRGSYTREDWELERARKELKAIKLDKKREEDKERYKKELEYQRLRDERKKEEEKKRLKKEADEAVEKFKIHEAERIAKEKKEKEEAERGYKKRLEEDLRKSGLDDRQIDIIMHPEKAALVAQRPTYTRMSRRHLSIETLNRFRVDYQPDQDPDFVLIKRLVPEWEQDFLWNHTREIRERRERERQAQPVLVAIESGKRTTHYHHHDTEYAIVRKKKNERKPSPSPLLTYFAGVKGK